MSRAENNLLVKANQLTVGWNGKAAAEKIDLSVQSKEILVVAGPNGAGKSTILKALARQLPPLGGSVELSGGNIWNLSAKDFARRVAYVPQSLEPGQDLTIGELVALGRNPHQRWWSWRASPEDREAVRQALEKTATWHLRDKYLSSVSGGERQRAIIAVALAQTPRCMLLDEPTAHLDFKHQLELVELLQDLRAQGLGIIVVLHDLNLMARLADLILLLELPAQGPSRAVCLDEPGKALNRSNLRQVYGVEVSVVSDQRTGRSVYTPVDYVR